MNPLPAWAHEVVVAPVAFALALLHARRALGLPRALAELGALVAYGFALEVVGIAVFRSHDYGQSWRIAPRGVPVAVALVWAAVISSVLAVAARRGLPTPPRRALAAGLIAIALDLAMEPVAVRLGLWGWTPPGAWQGVPAGNFVGWGVVVGAWCLGTDRDVADAPAARILVRRAGLAMASIVLLLITGLTWRGLGLERAFTNATGWVLAGLLWTSAVIVTARRRPATGWPQTLAGRLGATPGIAPESVLVLLTGAFAFEAFAFHERPLRLAAAGALGAIVFVSAASARFAFSDAWRSRALGRFAGVQDLVGVLMKPPNGQAWTEDDRRRLRSELRQLARWTPGFLLFLLPGGLLLLVLYAHLLDRRRLKRPSSPGP